MLRYIVLEDDQAQLEFLMSKLSLIPSTFCVGQFNNPLEAKSFLENHHVDLAFMDIEMPELNGLDLVQLLQHPPLIVFISSHTKFALSGYEMDAVDYIVKPVSLERLLVCFKKIEKLRSLLIRSSHEFEIKNPLDNAFFIKENGNYVKVYYEEVLYAESHNNFITLYLENGRKHLVLVNLKNFEDQLPRNFFLRISRTHIINISKVSAFNQQTVHIGNLQFAVGSAFADQVKRETFHIINRYSKGE